MGGARMTSRLNRQSALGAGCVLFGAAAALAAVVFGLGAVVWIAGLAIACAGLLVVAWQPVRARIGGTVGAVVILGVGIAAVALPPATMQSWTGAVAGHWQLDGQEYVLGSTADHLITSRSDPDDENGETFLRARALASGEPSWEVGLDDLANGTVVDDVVLVTDASSGSRSPWRAVSANDGKTLWEVETGDRLLAYADGVGMFSTPTDLEGVDLRTGAVEWTASLSESDSLFTEVRWPRERSVDEPVQSRYLISRPREATSAVVWNVVTGEQVWTGDVSDQELAVADDTLLLVQQPPAAFAGPFVHAVSAVALDQPGGGWSTTLEGTEPWTESQWAVRDGKLWFLNNEGVHRVDLLDGEADFVSMPDGWTFSRSGLDRDRPANRYVQIERDDLPDGPIAFLDLDTGKRVEPPDDVADHEITRWDDLGDGYLALRQRDADLVGRPLTRWDIVGPDGRSSGPYLGELSDGHGADPPRIVAGHLVVEYAHDAVSVFLLS